MDNNLLPITVIAAITIFVIKEVLEELRKYFSRQREVTAVKQMLADEIENNNYTIAILRRTLAKIKDDNEKYFVHLITTPSGSLRIEFKENDDDYGTSWPIPNVSRSIFDKTYIQLASLDQKLFVLAKDAYESISEVEHVRNSLIDFVEEDESRPEEFMVGFADYGIDILVDSYISMSKLYNACTGNDLDKNRLRKFA